MTSSKGKSKNWACSDNLFPPSLKICHYLKLYPLHPYRRRHCFQSIFFLVRLYHPLMSLPFFRLVRYPQSSLGLVFSFQDSSLFPTIDPRSFPLTLCNVESYNYFYILELIFAGTLHPIRNLLLAASLFL